VSGVITLSGTVVLLLAATAFVLYWLSYAAQHAGFVAYGLAVVGGRNETRVARR
jgi:hypothetical protein